MADGKNLRVKRIQIPRLPPGDHSPEVKKWAEAMGRVGQRQQEALEDLARQISFIQKGPAGSQGPQGIPGPAGGGGTNPLLSAYNPTTPGSLLAQFKADGSIFSDAGVTPVVNGDLVYQWNDESGNGLHFTQATAGNRPRFYHPPAGSDVPRVLFIENVRRLQRANEAGMTPADVSIFAAVSSSSVSGSRDVYSQYHQPDDKGYALGLVDGGASIPRITCDGNNVLQNSDFSLASNTVQVVGSCFLNAGGIRSLWLNGSKIASDAGVAMTYGGSIPTIGWLGYLGNVYNWLGAIYEILIYSKSLSDDEAADVSGYLSRWRNFSRGAT